MYEGLVGKSILVTGGASGIGRAIVEFLLKQGSNVTVADTNEAAGRALVAEAEQSRSGSAHFVKADISVESDVAAMVDAAVSTYGGLDGAVNNAGYHPHIKVLHELTADQWDISSAVNLRGTFLCFKYQIMAMLERGGSIVAISSTAAELAIRNGAEYCAMKAGINGLVRAAALDYAARGIRVNGVMPGSILTDGLRSVRAARGPAPTLELPMKRRGEAQEVAAGAAWLLSDHASYVTGAMLPIDGCLTATQYTAAGQPS